jgi:hypothetical protein
MSAFLFAHSTVHDTARFELYREASADSVARYGWQVSLLTFWKAPTPIAARWCSSFLTLKPYVPGTGARNTGR